MAAATRLTSGSEIVAATIILPDVLGGAPDGVEHLIEAVVAARPGEPVALCMANVTWVCPYGAVLLHGLCRYAAHRSRHLVRLTDLALDVHAYLRRIDFFLRVQGAAHTSVPFNANQDYARSRYSQSVVPLVPVRCAKEAKAVSRQASHVLRAQLGGTESEVAADILTVLSEVCHNVAFHSSDEGLVIAQRYEFERYTNVEIAISDLGRGIRRSLSAVHGEVADCTSGFIREALDGLSARQQSGMGLNRMQEIAVRGGGQLSIRSGDGCVTTSPAGTRSSDRLTAFPGTQIAVTFRAPK